MLNEVDRHRRVKYPRDDESFEGYLKDSAVESHPVETGQSNRQVQFGSFLIWFVEDATDGRVYRCNPEQVQFLDTIEMSPVSLGGGEEKG